MTNTPEEEKEAGEAFVCWQTQCHLKECEKCAPKDWEIDFDTIFTISYRGDSGMNGNDPQESVYELMDGDPKPIKNFIRNLLSSQSHKIEEDLKDKIQGLKEKEKYDVMVCSKCGNFIRERFSHNSEDGFSECCGKKLLRKQGEKESDTSKNYVLDEVISLLESNK